MSPYETVPSQSLSEQLRKALGPDISPEVDALLVGVRKQERTQDEMVANEMEDAQLAREGVRSGAVVRFPGRSLRLPGSAA